MPKLKGGGGRLGHGRHLSLHGIRDEVEYIKLQMLNIDRIV